MSAAQKRGVHQFLAFFNSPPVHLTRNKKAFASKGVANIDSNSYREFADYAVEAIRQVKKATGVNFNYISPVNEPQWDWSDNKQEGCPYTNAEISRLLKTFNKEFLKNHLTTGMVVPESGHLKYLLKSEDKPGKDDQINAFFNPSSTNYIGNLRTVKKTIASHSYFSTSPFQEAVDLRKQIDESISKINGLEFWQTEYCILGDNDGEINGSKRDLGMDAALYTARVVYEDLVWANASAWQWWLALSPYNYKDGLIYVDKNENDGNYHVSKMLWSLGNYSFFVRPGMKRIAASTNAKDLLVSAFKNKSDRSVVIIVNPSAKEETVSLKKSGVALAKGMVNTYITDASNNLKKNKVSINEVIVPAKSVITVIVD
jgi:O-glycosyl hydrolase